MITILIKCEFCSAEKPNQLGLCSGCGRFGRNLKECLIHYEFDVPKFRLNDVEWLRRNIMIHNSNNPEINRILNILK